jgi:hypothetical protein
MLVTKCFVKLLYLKGNISLKPHFPGDGHPAFLVDVGAGDENMRTLGPGKLSSDKTDDAPSTSTKSPGKICILLRTPCTLTVTAWAAAPSAKLNESGTLCKFFSDQMTYSRMTPSVCQATHQVVVADMSCAHTAVSANTTINVRLTHDSVTNFENADVFADGCDLTATFVPEHYRYLHEGGVGIDVFAGVNITSTQGGATDFNQYFVACRDIGRVDIENANRTVFTHVFYDGFHHTL